MRLIELAEEAGADKALRLKVGAAFHSVLMEPVQAQMAEAMADVRCRIPTPRWSAMLLAAVMRPPTRCARR